MKLPKELSTKITKATKKIGVYGIGIFVLLVSFAASHLNDANEP